jgi:flavin reductase (DIM6/NTAB) family NADH-FMN oxidoreductase RutF
MSSEFKSIDPETLQVSPFTLFAKEWPLLTAGRLDHYNGMTIGWGGLGSLWRRPTATVYVRPQRHTFQFVEKEPYFSLSILDGRYKSALDYFGKKSGRDVNKAKETGLTPSAYADKTVYFQEARLVLILKKIYATDFKKSEFIGLDPDQFYTSPGEYHRLYIGEVVDLLERKAGG